MSIGTRYPARLHYSCGTVTPRTWLAVLAAVLIVAACGGQTQGSPGLTDAAAATGATNAPLPTLPPAGPSLTPTATPGPTPGPTAQLADGFHYSDILKVKVNRLAARIAPKRTSALVHGYDLSGPAPEDKGDVRLSTGDYVSVELGPLPIGDTVWYLVWPATAAALHPEGTQWYTTPPIEGAPIPAWVAASVGSDVYMSLQRRPDLAEIEAFSAVGVVVAGIGNYTSGPQARHDGFSFQWAAAAPVSGTSCALKIALVPEDEDFDEKVAVQTTTTTVKVGPLAGSNLNAPWLPVPEGSWGSFAVKVTSTCNWAFRLLRLEHD